MSGVGAGLADLLEPLRDLAVGELLEMLAEELDRGGEVEAEPKIRDASGRAVRDGALMLPRRGDIAILRGGRRLVRRIHGGAALDFKPMAITTGGGFTSVIAPFSWHSAEILLLRGASSPGWSPLRLWYLEWFQSRYSEVAPDLDGALHSLSGPADVPQGWRLVIDFGSAPVEAVADLIVALERTGCAGVRFGPSD